MLVREVLTRDFLHKYGIYFASGIFVIAVLVVIFCSCSSGPSNYGWAPSVGYYTSSDWWAYSGTNYKGPADLAPFGKSNSLKTNPIWLHGASDRN